MTIFDLNSNVECCFFFLGNVTQAETSCYLPVKSAWANYFLCIKCLQRYCTLLGSVVFLMYALLDEI